MRLGFFGGSFDPPHRGHLAVARAAQQRFQLDRVLLAPTGRQPLKPGGASASFSDRLAMTELLCASEPGLEASAIDSPEADGMANYTVDTLRRLRAGHPEATEVFSIVGADTFLGLPHWRDVPALFALAEWIVVSRPGSALETLGGLALTPAEQARTHLLPGMADPASATEIRQRLRLGDPCTDLLPPGIRTYIQAHGLYRSEKPGPA